MVTGREVIAGSSGNGAARLILLTCVASLGCLNEQEDPVHINGALCASLTTRTVAASSGPRGSPDPANKDTRRRNARRCQGAVLREQKSEVNDWQVNGM